MKSVASKVVGMVAAVACLALVLNRPVGAEDQDQPEVKEQTKVIVVQADGDTDVAEAVKKALDEKLKGLPKEVQEKVRQKLQGIKMHQPLKIQAAPAPNKSDSGKSAKDSDKKAIAIAVAVDDDVVGAKEGSKEFTVSIKDGKVFLNGKPVSDIKDARKKEIRVQVVGDADTDAKKSTRRRIVFMGEDGKVQEFEFDGEVDVEHVVVGKTDKADTAKNGPQRVLIHKLEGEGPRKEIRVQLGTGVHPPVPHAVLAGQADKVHADVTQRLKSIESELKKIRQLLQKMQDDDEDQDEAQHGHEGESDHEHNE